MMIEPSNEIDRVAKLLSAEWERVEGSQSTYHVSHEPRPRATRRTRSLATFAVLARVVVADAQAPQTFSVRGLGEVLGVCGHEFSQSKQ